MKQAVRRKHLSAVGSNRSMIAEEIKNALIQRGRDEARATFIKKLAVSDSL